MNTAPALLPPETQVLHTVAVYLAGDTQVRVHVDQLAGTPAEAAEDAVAIVMQLGSAAPAGVLTRLVATDEVPDAVINSPTT